MRVALLSDIHGNIEALDAVIGKALSLNVSKFLCCGDLVGYYYAGKEVLNRFRGLDWAGVRGNHEDLFEQWCSGDGITKRRIELKYGSSFSSLETVLDSEDKEMLQQLPETRIEVIGGVRLLLCHGSPWDPNEYVYPDASTSVCERMSEEIDADVIVFGHTHYQVEWVMDGLTIVNPGSVGQQRERKLGACWGLFDSDTGEISLRRESYDSSRLEEECSIRDPELPYLRQVLVRGIRE